MLSDMTSMQNGSPVGRAIVGGILAGGIGAIIGVGSGLSNSEACKSLKVRVTLFNDQFIDEPFIAQPVKTSSAFYRNICASCSELYSTCLLYTSHQFNDKYIRPQLIDRGKCLFAVFRNADQLKIVRTVQHLSLIHISCGG